MDQAKTNNNTALNFETLFANDEAFQPILTPILKVTYEILADGRLQFSEQQLPINPEGEYITAGDACLTGHDGSKHSKFRRKQTCNYRYQAVEQAKNNSELKKYLHSYNDVLDQIAVKYSAGVKTSAYKANSENMSPARYCLKIDMPKRVDWDLGGPKKQYIVKILKAEMLT
jgi:hypothetical protein